MRAKFTSCLILTLLLAFSCQRSTPEKKEKQSDKISAELTTPEQGPVGESDDFSLYFSHVGLGSNMGSMQPVFKVDGLKFTYTNEQTSFYGEQTKKPIKICEGEISESAIDSIIGLVDMIEDSLVYRTNVGILSGGVHTIYIHKGAIDITFSLHNETDSTAEKIVAILNAYIPDDKLKLWLFNSHGIDETEAMK